MLRRCVVPALLLFTACRSSLDEAPDASGTGRICKVSTVATCMTAETKSDLAWIEMNIFAAHCAFSGCHNNTATAAGRLDLKNPGMSHADLVGVDSAIAQGKKIVVAGQPKQSYLLLMMQQFRPAEFEPSPVAPPPSDIGFMPQ